MAEESATESDEEKEPAISSSTKKRKKPSSQKIRSGSEKASITKNLTSNVKTQEHIGNVSRQIKKCLISPPISFPFYTQLPFVAHVYDDQREGATITYKTADSVVPFPLVDLRGHQPGGALAEKFVEKMLLAMMKFEEKWWPN